MISVFLMGGLGNQLFQIFATIAYAIQYQTPFVLPYEEKLTTGIIRPTYWNTFFQRLFQYTTQQKGSMITNTQLFQLPRHLEQRYYKHHIIPRYSNNVLLYGYFQSYKYFDRYSEQITEFIGVRQYQAEMRARFKELFEDCDGKAIVSMHFRIGDYAEKQDYHPVMTVDYYINSINYLIKVAPNTSFILYFCEEENKSQVEAMVSQMRAVFPKIFFIRADDSLADWEQLILMSCCSHHIIANSTFSWWGAFFNPKPEKFVFYPDKWLGEKMRAYDIDDLIPSPPCTEFGTWIKISTAAAVR